MRLWTLHPKYLDRQGLLAVWREGLLAQAVLKGKTKGYKNHPQLDRFKSHSNPLQAVSNYLLAVQAEATARGYKFDVSKIGTNGSTIKIQTTSGQMAFEFDHLLKKLKKRSPLDHRRLVGIKHYEPHPLFEIILGGVEDWEKGVGSKT